LLNARGLEAIDIKILIITIIVPKIKLLFFWQQF
jgi:hypothetical protein